MCSVHCMYQHESAGIGPAAGHIHNEHKVEYQTSFTNLENAEKRPISTNLGDHVM